MIIAVDIGNSTITIGYFREKGIIVQKIRTKPRQKVYEYAALLNRFMAKNRIEKTGFNVIISSVVSSHTATVGNAFKRLSRNSEICVVSHKMRTGLGVQVKHPERLGTDRLASAAGAYIQYGTPVAVVDFGTATTITVVDSKANLIGGAIMPGIGLMNTALDAGTGSLKKINLTAPVNALGRDTDQCIASGILYGTAGAVERILDGIEGEIGEHLKTVITGGYCQMMDSLIQRPHETNMLLTLEGLRTIYETNRTA